jgi:hypothetical protein
LATGTVLEDEASREEDAERAEFAEWKGASVRTLQELWDNDKDAVYDALHEVSDDLHD